MSGKPKTKHPGGRPSRALAEDTVLVSGPAVLLAAVEQAAHTEGISVREWWRRAARLRLGWHEILPDVPSD